MDKKGQIKQALEELSIVIEKLKGLDVIQSNSFTGDIGALYYIRIN
jgi:hypothetical protein|tara:strand:+ start:1506 stop:1643 length:138 start_codon:yes stop_codon:yes gene_type:complete